MFIFFVVLDDVLVVVSIFGVVCIVDDIVFYIFGNDYVDVFCVSVVFKFVVVIDVIDLEEWFVRFRNGVDGVVGCRIWSMRCCGCLYRFGGCCFWRVCCSCSVVFGIIELY